MIASPKVYADSSGSGMDDIETTRLWLRCGHDGDVDGLCAGLNDWSVAQWLVRPPFPYRRKHAEQFVELTRMPGVHGFHPFRIIADRASGLLVGVISLEPSGSRAELGYWLLPSARGQGYMSEAADALIVAGGHRLPEVSPIYATTDPDNLPSQAVLSRLDFDLVGEQPRQGKRRPSKISFLYERPMRLEGVGKGPAPAHS
jgi:RimJ/RimL family protein N-acetyltransferase